MRAAAKGFARAVLCTGLTAVLVGLMASPALAQSAGQVQAGRGIAKRFCGECHGLDGARSPLADAPRFDDLYRRYPPGRLDGLLLEGMLAPVTPPEEGSPPRHPRMPMQVLGEDEIVSLKAYLRSLDPRRRSASGERRSAR